MRYTLYQAVYFRVGTPIFVVLLSIHSLCCLVAVAKIHVNQFQVPPQCRTNQVRTSHNAMNEKMTRVLIVPTINHPPKQGMQSSLRDKQNDDGSQHPAF